MEVWEVEVMRMSEAYLDYFYADESQQFRFLMIPMELYDNHVYDDLDGAAPAVYAAMLSRIRLSKKNGWIDSKNRVYIMFSLKDVMKYGKCKRDKARKIMEELETCVPGGLIERDTERQIIFVKNFQHKDRTKTGGGKTDHNQINHVDNFFTEVGKTAGGSDIPEGADRKERIEEVGKTDPSNIDLKNNTADIDPSIHLKSEIDHEQKDLQTSQDGVKDRAELYEKIIKNNISYDKNMHDLKGLERDLFAMIYKVICDVVINSRESIRISGADRPYEAVKSVFLKLKDEQVMYAVYRIVREQPDMRMPQNYIRTCLYDAFISADAGYSMAAYGGRAI